MRLVIGLILVAFATAHARGEIDFATEVMPVLTKAGCNAGACHGAAAGRGGFHLSLLGGDAAADHAAIVHDFKGRRINLARPDASLLLKKPTGYLDHGGGVALDDDSAGARVLRAWIQAGAQFGPRRELTRFEVSPADYISDSLPAIIDLRAMASFDQAAAGDVTAQTLFTVADPGSVEIDPVTNRATIKRRGQHVVIARFLNRVVPLTVTVPLAAKPVDHSAQRRANFIDDEVLRTLTTLRLPVSPPADDAAYLRRLRLDLTGRLPTPKEVAAYLGDASSEKRATLVDRLLASVDFADYWTLHFARQLHLHSVPNEPEIAKVYAGWLHTQIDQGTPLNEWAAQLLTASGDSHEVAPANFSRMSNDARGQAELVGEFFLGVRLGCANCHNHPLDRWTQDDYHGLAAVFSRLSRGRIVQINSRGGVTNPRTGEEALPRIPGERSLAADGDHREVVARWLTSRENHRFAQATVNRLWKAMLGRGMVEPADNLSETNPATHPDLLSRLAQDFVEHDYSLRHTLRLIALSETYARSDLVLPGNAADDRYYSHALRRALGPEVLADAVADVTGVPNEFANQPAGTRAIAMVDPLSPAPALNILCRCARATGCDDQPTGGGLPAQLHLLNGPFVNEKLIAKRGRLQELLSAGASPETIVREFFLRGLSREPSTAELAHWTQQLGSSSNAVFDERCEDFVWSLLNSRNFRENH